MQLRATFETGAASPQQFPTAGYPEIAFAGRSNVGKSSLLNMLVGARQLARVSSTPGKTQQINFFLVEERMRFVDLPGYGYAKASQEHRREWGRLITEYFECGRPISMVVQLIDARLPLQESDARVMQWFVNQGLPLQVALTKVDKLKQGERVRQERSLREGFLQLGYRGSCIMLSSLKGTGKQELLNAIFTRLDVP
jgi:GTP-binding protein